MKKRLLALALCLVLATSLLPITAAADMIDLDQVSISVDTITNDTSGYKMNIDFWSINSGGQTVSNAVCSGGEIYTDPSCSSILQKAPICGNTYFVKFRIQPQNEGEYYNGDGLDALSSSLSAPGYKTVWRKTDSEGSGVVLVFELKKDHSWQMTHTENTLTAECVHDGCPIRKVSVELKADSVTLPNSPFNARLEGWEQLVSEFPHAKRSKFDYKYKGPGDSEYRPVDPIAANAKAGEYQVGVNLWDIGRAPIDPSEGNYLFVKYTAVDPAVTAQTGDNRPIELMMVGAAVFSALAAAAFVVDSRRRSQP